MFVRLILNTLAFLFTSYILQEFGLGFHVVNFWWALLAALVIGFLNSGIKPFLLLVTLPLNIFTLGLSSLFLNALLFYLAVSIVPGVYVDSFWTALAGMLLFSVFSTMFSRLFGK
jgi:putative membrane protein